MKINLSENTVDEIVISDLRRSYESCLKEINLLSQKDSLKFHEEEDLDYNQKLQNAFEVILMYYLPRDQALSYISLMRKENNISKSQI
jgi:hypothetical protein